MSTQNEIRDYILAAFVAAWSATPYALENQAHDPTVGASWVRIVVHFVLRKQKTIGVSGNRKFTGYGQVIMQVFVPKDSPMSVSDSIEQAAIDLYEGQTINEIYFYDVRSTDAGISDETWHQTNIAIDFDFDFIK